MVKQSLSRNHRSKGIKGTHILQICVLLAVCFWLIYQVKHSHDKKKAFDEHDAKISQTTRVPDEILKFGRKDRQPRLEETIMKNEKHDEEEVEEEDTGGEEEENNEEQEDSKTEEKDDEGRGGGDDEIDENDQEKSEIEAERDEEFIDEEKDREEGDEKETEEKEGWNKKKETEEKDSKDKEGRNENEKEAEEKDSRDGGNRSAHEAREENYKGDDASSAVTHDTEAITSETERGSVDNSKEDTDMDGQEEESKSNDTMGSEAEKGENGTSPNVTGKEDEGSFEIVSSKSEDSSPLNSTMTIESNTRQELGNNSTEQHLDVHNILLQNGTETKPDATEAQMGGTATVDLIAVIGESSNSSTTTDFTLSEKVKTSNASVGVEGQSESLTKEGNADGTQIEKSEASNRTDKIQDSSETGNTDEVHHDSIDSSDSSIPLEGKDISTDLDTVLEIRNEGSNNEDAAAE
ncbi:Papilin like [Actinidia chinensis var. chinensis]|uniref:Papilin like n=1 Tax=Actinidia chinensis var. chinensis TaxID=1590841 RepID=A0A2R6RGU3_ACTCC|nr:Papilin like [Actinidia chinensis var. chinensis]